MLRAGLRLLEHHEWVEALEAAIAEGGASVARGDYTALDGEDAIRAFVAGLAPQG